MSILAFFGLLALMMFSLYLMHLNDLATFWAVGTYDVLHVSNAFECFSEVPCTVCVGLQKAQYQAFMAKKCHFMVFKAQADMIKDPIYH